MTMQSFGDYASVLELGFAINVAATFVNSFTSPILSRARADYNRADYWLSNPEKMERLNFSEAAKNDLEDSLAQWYMAIHSLEKEISNKNIVVDKIGIAAAIGCFLLLLIPQVELYAPYTPIIATVLAIGPMGLSMVWISDKTSIARKKERVLRDKTNVIISEAQR
ncbi:hypothetical protein [Maritalea myrionectae]|uniref:hypothetical protein n=1 Tax=Maritalea myrionectae TaxID=454601 RepID=UPI0004898FE6|nr:hypothetical protein [Maritalea myrionectae]